MVPLTIRIVSHKGGWKMPRFSLLSSTKTGFSLRNALLLLLITALLMTACGVEEEPVSGAEMHLTFTGDSCTYEGPTLLKEGSVTLVYHNESDGIAAVNLARHTGDETIQDAIDNIGEEPDTGHAPPWMEDLGTWEYIQAGESLNWEGVLEAGIHTMVCARGHPHGVWFGTGLTVVE
jgi:hypothetical protein